MRIPVSPGPAGGTFAVRVIPRAKRSALDGARGDALLVRLAAPPVDGAANDALVAILAEVFEVPRGRISIVSGETSRDKRVAIAGLSPDAIVRRLAAILT